MSRPEEFTIHIEPDGRIVFDSGGMTETSYKRILELLADTVGPVQPIADEAPPERRIVGGRKAKREEAPRLDRKA